jgi:DNA repair protein RadC
MATPRHDISAAELLAIARGMAERPQRDLISSWDALLAYLHLQHGNPRKEVFRVLFLDRKNCLIVDKIMGEGTIDHCPVYVREIMREALLCDASAIIIAHNHPSGDPKPSQADIDMTRQIVDACGVIGITFHDHVVIGNGREVSLRQAGKI